MNSDIDFSYANQQAFRGGFWEHFFQCYSNQESYSWVDVKKALASFDFTKKDVGNVKEFKRLMINKLKFSFFTNGDRIHFEPASGGKRKVKDRSESSMAFKCNPYGYFLDKLKKSKNKTEAEKESKNNIERENYFNDRAVKKITIGSAITAISIQYNLNWVDSISKLNELIDSGEYIVFNKEKSYYKKYNMDYLQLKSEYNKNN